MARITRIHHQRHGQFDRVRRGKRFIGWLSEQATRLTTTSAAVYFALTGSSAARIGAIANIDLPVITVAPVVSGTAQAGQTLTVTAGTVTGTPAPTVTRQWMNSVTGPIKGATGLTYLVQASDVGATIRCRTDATNVGGSVYSNSNSTAAVIAA